MKPFDYVGPDSLRARAAGSPGGTPITSRDTLARWLASPEAEPDVEKVDRFLIEAHRSRMVAHLFQMSVTAVTWLQGTDGVIHESMLTDHPGPRTLRTEEVGVNGRRGV